MAERDQDPLLGHDRSSNDSTHDAPHPVARWLGAAYAGFLPTNDQLYMGLHRIAGTLEGFASAAGNASSSGAQTVDEPPNRNEPARTSHTLFREVAGLARDVASWITQSDAEQEVDTLQSGHDAVEKKKIHVPNGNSREQIQRVIYHARKVRVHVQADVPGVDVEQAKEGLKEIASDSADLLNSLFRIAMIAATSSQLRSTANDALNAVRDSVASKAQKTSEAAQMVQAKADSVLDAAQPTTSEREEELPIQAVAVKAAAVAADAKDRFLAAGKSSGEEHDKHEEGVDVLDAIANRLASIFGDIQSDPQSVDALDNISQIMRKYIESGAHLVQKAKETASEASTSDATQVASDSFSVESNRHLGLAVDAAKEVVEGLAGGTSLQSIQTRCQSLFRKGSDNVDVREWFSDCHTFVQDSVKNAREAAKSAKESDDAAEAAMQMKEKLKDKLRELLQRGRDLFKKTPDVESEYKQLINLLDDFKSRILENQKNQGIRERIGNLFGLVKSALKGGIRAAKHEWKDLMSDLLSAILPQAFSIIKIIPVPRIEFTSDKLDAVIDHVSIPTLTLIPERVNVQSSHDYTWRKHSSSNDLTSSMKLTVDGLRFGINNISFYAQERYTAPQPTRCWGCCGCGAGRSCGGGPSNWLSYTERALLDVGFEGDGITAMLDIKQIETKTNEEEEKRTRFFEVNDTDLDLSDSFVFSLRNSRHWILNSILFGVARPTVRLIMQRVGQAQLQHGFESLDERIFDIYARARYNAWQRDHKRGLLVEHEPRTWDYLRVLFSSTVGKSQERIAREEKEAEDKKKEEAQQWQEQQQVIDQQPSLIQQLEIKSSGLVKHDASGQYTIAIGLGQTLLPGKSGPPTPQMQAKNDLLEGNWKSLCRRVAKPVEDVLEETRPAERLEAAKDGGVSSTKAVVSTLGEARDIGQDTKAEDGWKTDAFDF